MLKEESKAESMMKMMARFSGIMHSRRPFGDMPRAEFCVLNLLYDYKEKEEVTVGKIAGELEVSLSGGVKAAACAGGKRIHRARVQQGGSPRCFGFAFPRGERADSGCQRKGQGAD